ncbi:MAG: ATP-binding cassette domain-containing protein [Defluviitaleaceae bacterium]|nr:ATP-binding cassette domain-containing protein [Defluviitaleaceae bacterium]
MFLQIKDITKKFGKQTALNNVSAEIEKGEFVCILGPSGCGKTTLLRTIAGLELPTSGQIFIDGKDSTYLHPAKRNFGIVFQSYALFPNMTIVGNIMFGLQQKKKSMTKQEMENKALDVLRMVDLYDHRNKYPRQLSGGMQQRTALARAIALSPAFLLLDEPLSALDAKVRHKLRTEIRSIQQSLKITAIMVTHDQEEALTMADKIIVMNNSVVEQIGAPREVYDKPVNPFVANFIGTMNFLQRSGQTRAIRPEQIEIVDHRDEHDVTVRIKHIEFKGVLTRIHAFLPNQTTMIYLDVPSEQIDDLQLNENGMLFLRLPQEHLIDYPQGAA